MDDNIQEFKSFQDYFNTEASVKDNDEVESLLYAEIYHDTDKRCNALQSNISELEIGFETNLRKINKKCKGQNIVRYTNCSNDTSGKTDNEFIMTCENNEKIKLKDTSSNMKSKALKNKFNEQRSASHLNSKSLNIKSIDKIFKGTNKHAIIQDQVNHIKFKANKCKSDTLAVHKNLIKYTNSNINSVFKNNFNNVNYDSVDISKLKKHCKPNKHLSNTYNNEMGKTNNVSDRCMNDNDSNIDTRYNALLEHEKSKVNIEARIQTDTILDITDSDNSISEVPLFPKPEPVVINLNDSDEESTNRKDSHNTKKASNRIESLLFDPFHLNVSENISSSMDTIFTEKDTDTSVDISNNCGGDRMRTLLDFTEDISLNNISFCEQKIKKRKISIYDDMQKSDVNAKKAKIFGFSNSRLSEKSKTLLNDEEWTSYFFQPMSKQLRAFYDRSRGQENFDHKAMLNKMPRDSKFWRLHHHDKISRYRSTYGSHKNERFLNSNNYFCHYCGVNLSYGQEMCDVCPSLHCTLCNLTGHEKTKCPDLWRRYHQTVSGLEINIPKDQGNSLKPNHLLSCCYCCKSGHDVSTCTIAYNFQRHVATPVTISNYTEGPVYFEDGSLQEGQITDQSFRDVNNDLMLDSSTAISLTDHSSNKVIFYHKKIQKMKNWKEIKVTLNNKNNLNTALLWRGKKIPNFLYKLKKVPFLVKIESTILPETVILTVGAPINIINDLYWLILFWMSLSDNDKDDGIFVDLPWKRKQLLDIFLALYNEWNDIKKGNVRELCKEVVQIQADLERDQEMYKKMYSSLKSKKRNINMCMFKERATPKDLRKFRSTMLCLKNLKMNVVRAPIYINALYIFNKVFSSSLPYYIMNLKLYFEILSDFKELLNVRRKDIPTVRLKEIKHSDRNNVRSIKNLQIQLANIANSNNNTSDNGNKKQNKMNFTNEIYSPGGSTILYSNNFNNVNIYNNSRKITKELTPSTNLMLLTTKKNSKATKHKCDRLKDNK